MECSFTKNIVYYGKGSVLLAERYQGMLELRNCTMTSFTNAVYLEEGHDLIVDNLTIGYEQNQIVRKANDTFYSYFLEKNNSTRKADEEYFREREAVWATLPP